MAGAKTRIKADVVIVGMGAAGMMAALEAARQGANVYAISKMPYQASNCTTRAFGDFTYSTAQTAEELFAQVVETGGFLNDQRLVEALVEGVPRGLEALREVGVELDEPRQASAEMPGTVRWSYRGRDAGTGMTEAIRQAAEQAGAKFLWGQAATRVLRDGERAAGLTTIDLTERKVVAWQAKSVVIATGGGACAWPRTDNPPGATGDGIVLAYQAGAELVDLECVSFGFPEQRLGELFTAPKVPHEPLLELGHAHYFLGGIRIDEHGATSVPGLYAAGEASGGLFGAGRLGGSALADTVIFGARAGRAAALAAREADVADPSEDQIDEEERLLQRVEAGAASPAEIGEKLRGLLWRWCGTMKTAETLATALAELEALRQETEDLGAGDREQLREALEVRNILRLGELVARASLQREETRGCFWRVDHPEPDNERQLGNIVIRKTEGGPELRAEPPVMTRMTEPTEPRIGPGCFGYAERSVRRGD